MENIDRGVIVKRNTNKIEPFNFFYPHIVWLDLETSGYETELMDMIKKHLTLVFKHEIDPSMGDEKHQKKLNEIHNKPTLEELGKEHNFEVINNYGPKHGEKPGPDYLYSSFHGWCHPDEGIPRC